LRRPWRQERESVSAAFSKWVRTTMFEITEEGDSHARVQLLDMERQVQRLQDECDRARQEREQSEVEGKQAIERERNGKRELQSQLRDYRDKEQELYEDIQRISQERDKLRRASLESQNGGPAFADREAELQRREANLRQLEDSMADKQQQVSEANDRIRTMAQQLREKEMDLDARLGGELRKYEAAQERLQQLIAQMEKQQRDEDEATLTARQL